jgi:recombination protein RecA
MPPKKKKSTGAEKTAPVDREHGIVESLKKLGVSDESIMLLDYQTYSDIKRRSSGVLSLDLAIGGGYPWGRLVEIYGPESCGKTTITLQAIAEVQDKGGAAAFIDAEHALDVKYAEVLGVNTSKLLISQPGCGEEALELVEKLASVMLPGDIIVIDSVAALTPRAEIEGEMGDSHMGLQARLMSQAMRKLAAVVSKSGVIVIFINQIRHKIGVMFGSPETTTGGNALKFYSSLRIEIRKSGNVKKGDEVIGNGVKLKCVKNKLYPPFKQAEVALRYGLGIPRNIEILTVGSLVGIVEKSGAWWSYNGERLGHGLDNAAAAVTPEMLDEIEHKILERYQIKRG